MEIRIQSIHFDASEQLKTFAQKKAEKSSKYFENIQSIEISLKVIKPETATNKEAGIKLIIPGNEFFASKISNTFEESIDEAFEALHKQLQKNKEKQRVK